MTKKEYKWKKQTTDPDYKAIDCPAYDPIGHFQRDPSGCYVLIRLEREAGRLELAVCDKNHVITHVFSGGKPQDIYHAIFKHEKIERAEFFANKQHTAYLGKELQRAYHALLSGKDYVQE